MLKNIAYFGCGVHCVAVSTVLFKNKNPKVPKPKETWNVFGTLVLCFIKWYFLFKLNNNVLRPIYGTFCFYSRKSVDIEKIQTEKEQGRANITYHNFCSNFPISLSVENLFEKSLKK